MLFLIAVFHLEVHEKDITHEEIKKKILALKFYFRKSGG